MIVLAFALAYAGMTALCFAMDRHYAVLFGHSPLPGHSRFLRLAGPFLLASAFIIMVYAYGAATGIVVTVVITSVAGLCLIFCLPYAPRLTIALVPVAGLVALTGLLILH